MLHAVDGTVSGRVARRDSSSTKRSYPTPMCSAERERDSSRDGRDSVCTPPIQCIFDAKGDHGIGLDFIA